MAEELPPTELPPVPRVSEDGQWYWDGSRWVPRTATPAAPVPPPPVVVTQTSGSGLQTFTIACIGVIVGFIVIGIVLVVAMGSCLASISNATPTP